MPEFLLGLRARAEAFAENPPGGFQQVLVTEYPPGAGIGWHKDRSVFGDVAGISLLSPCTFRMRRRMGDRFERKSLTAEPLTSCAAPPAPNGSTVFPAWKRFAIPLHFATYLKRTDGH